jgi:hypothetical protein
MFDRLRPNRGNTVARRPATSNELTPEPSATTPRASTNDPNSVREKRASGADLEGQTTATDDGWIDPYGPAPGVKGWFKLYWHDLTASVTLFCILGI